MKKLKNFSNTLSRTELKDVSGGGTSAGAPICFGTCTALGCQIGGYPDCFCLLTPGTFSGRCFYVPRN